MRNLLVVILMAGLLTSCKKQINGTVRYEVTCIPDGFNVIYENSSGQTEQNTITSGIWSTSYTGTFGDTFYVSAQAEGEQANITVTVYFKGRRIENNRDSGDYAIATGYGSLR